VNNQTVNTKDEEQIEINPTFNQQKTIDAINNQLINNDKDGNHNPDYKATKIENNTITFEYEVSFVQNRTNNTTQVKDERTVDVDNQNKLIIPDS
jgi:hypothetical protein